MQALADGPLGALAPADEIRGGRERPRPPPLAHDFVEGKDELVPLGLLGDEPDGRLDQVHAAADASEQRERLAELHRPAGRDVVGGSQ